MRPRNNYIIFFLLAAFIFLIGLSNSSLDNIQKAIVEGDYEKAESLAQDLIKANPGKEQYNEALYYKGVSRLKLGDYSGAREAFNLLIAEYPKEELCDKAYLGIIDSFSLEGEYFKAAKTVNKLLEKSPKSQFLSMIYLKGARANLRLARWQKARIYLKKIIRKFPDSFEAHRARQLLDEEQYFAVQVGAFIDPVRAEDLVYKLNDQGQYAYMVETIDRFGQKFYRVRVGKVTTLREAQDLKTRLSKLGYPTLIYP